MGNFILLSCKRHLHSRFDVLLFMEGLSIKHTTFYQDLKTDFLADILPQAPGARSEVGRPSPAFFHIQENVSLTTAEMLRKEMQVLHSGLVG